MFVNITLFLGVCGLHKSGYGGPSTELLIKLSRFEEATSLVEFGHGSGAFAYRLFERSILPSNCQVTHTTDFTQSKLIRVSRTLC